MSVSLNFTMLTTYENTVRPEFDTRSKTYRISYDPDRSTSVSTTLVLSLCSLTGDEPTQMRPLSRAVDPDVLESHVQSRDRGSDISFEFHDHQVTVQDDGQIEFTPIDAQSE